MARIKTPLRKVLNVDKSILNKRIAFVIANYYVKITDKLYDSGYQILIQQGFSKEYISKYEVSGAFELPYATQNVITHHDAAICLGCVIQGETKHFDYICETVAKGLLEVSLKVNKPIIFGVLTTKNMYQTLDRVGGKHGNKGEDFAYAAISALSFQQKL